MGTFRSPVGPLPSSVYWRRRLVVLGVPLFVILLVAYACSGSSGTPPRNTAGGTGVSSSPSPSGDAVITPAPNSTQSGPPEGSYPGSGPGGAAGGSGGTGNSTASTAAATGSAAAGASGGTAGGAGATTGGGGSGCALTRSVALDRTASSGVVTYPAGTYPTFKITATDTGAANCTVDVSGRTLVVTVAAQGSSNPAWTSVTCSGASDLRVLGPTDAQTFPVQWKRWESQGSTCPVSKLPTVSPGGYTVSAAVDGVSATPVSFVLD